MSHPAALDREEVASEGNPSPSGLTSAEAGERSLLNRGRCAATLTWQRSQLSWCVRHRSGYRHTTGSFFKHANRIHMARSVAASQHLLHLSFGKLHRGHVLSHLEQLSVLRPSGQGQRTSSRARGGNREDGAHYH